MPVLPHHRSAFTRSRAFTIAEVVTVVAVLAIGAAVAIPRYANSICSFRAESAARRVEADLKYAQAAAKAASASRTVVFAAGTSSYAVAQVRELDLRGSGYSVSLIDTCGARVSSVDFGGDTTVVFNAYGMPDSSGSVQVRSGTAGWEVSLDGGTGLTRVARVP